MVTADKNRSPFLCTREREVIQIMNLWAIANTCFGLLTKWKRKTSANSDDLSKLFIEKTMKNMTVTLSFKGYSLIWHITYLKHTGNY